MFVIQRLIFLNHVEPQPARRLAAFPLPLPTPMPSPDGCPASCWETNGLVDPPNIRTCSRTRSRTGCKNLLERSSRASGYEAMRDSGVFALIPLIRSNSKATVKFSCRHSLAFAGYAPNLARCSCRSAYAS